MEIDSILTFWQTASWEKPDSSTTPPGSHCPGSYFSFLFHMNVQSFDNCICSLEMWMPSKAGRVFQFLRLTFDFQWQSGWISAIFHVAQSLTLTNRTAYSAGMAGNPWWWDLFMLSMHSFKTVRLSSCLGWVELCYNRVELRPLLLKAQSSSFIQHPPGRRSIWSTASSLCCFKYCSNDMQNHMVFSSLENQQRSHCICLLFILRKQRILPSFTAIVPCWLEITSYTNKM